MRRAFRMGQQRKVHVCRMILSDSIDERMFSMRTKVAPAVNDEQAAAAGCRSKDEAMKLAEIKQLLT